METIRPFILMVIFIILGIFRIINFNDADNLIGTGVIFALAVLFGIAGIYFFKKNKKNEKKTEGL